MLLADEDDLPFAEFQKFIDEQDVWVNNKYKVNKKSEQAYARMTKVAEEVGEMASTLGCALGRQR